MDIVWWSIFASWVGLVFSVRSQQELASDLHPNHHDDRGKMFKLAVIGSALLASLVSVVLIDLHYQAFGLLWTIGLSVGGGVLAAAVWGALSAIVGDLLLGLVSFGVWPLAAVGFFLLLGLAER